MPVGTHILSDDKGILADFTEVGQRIVLLRAGDGGPRHASAQDSTNAPRAQGKAARRGIVGRLRLN